MAGGWGTETEFELTTLEQLRALGYTHAIGAEIAEKHREADSEVVFRKILREHLTKRYPKLPAESIDEIVRVFARPDGVDTLRRNMERPSGGSLSERRTGLVSERRAQFPRA